MRQVNTEYNEGCIMATMRENLTETEKDALEFENGVTAFKQASAAFHKETSPVGRPITVNEIKESLGLNND